MGRAPLTPFNKYEMHAVFLSYTVFFYFLTSSLFVDEREVYLLKVYFDLFGFIGK